MAIKLVDGKGELVVQYGTKARYYHIEASNSRPAFAARNVEVVFTKLERPGADGGWVTDYDTAPIPLVRQFASHNEANVNVPGKKVFDLGYLQQGSAFTVCARTTPEGLNTAVNSGERVRVHLVAMAENAVSNELIVEISWDGKWEADTAEMSKHLVVKRV